MTPKTKQREIKRITSNLPEVYNRYFFNADKDEKTTDQLRQQKITEEAARTTNKDGTSFLDVKKAMQLKKVTIDKEQTNQTK